MLREKLTVALLWTTMAAAILVYGVGAKCRANESLVSQTQVGFGTPPKFKVEIKNTCPMCPAIDIHISCGNFSQLLANPRVFRVLSYNDCVVCGGLPLAPLQTVSFTYSHGKFPMSLKYSDLQCE